VFDKVLMEFNTVLMMVWVTSDPIRGVLVGVKLGVLGDFGVKFWNTSCYGCCCGAAFLW
jgi:F0F1-type ATP synthase assembly protein I